MDNEYPDVDELKPDRDIDDAVSVDLGENGDRLTIGDSDRDRRADWVETLRSDGSSSTLLDADESGLFETELDDRDGDGRVDEVATDLDEDAITDVIQEDENGDGRLDSISLVQTETTVRLDPDTGLVDSIEEGRVAAEPTPGRPADASSGNDEDAIHGDPGADIQWAQVQSENGFCVPASVGMIVSEITGLLQTETEMVGTAIELNLLYGSPGAWVGMTTEGTVELLEHFGVDSHVEYGTLDDLRSHLDDDLGIILMVDADELWTSSADDVQLSDMGADHAVVITGIDDERAVITLNDPGQPDGAGSEITIADFMDAWDDSNYEMVVTDAAPQGEEAVHGSLSAIRHPVGYVLLPVTVREDTLRRTERVVLRDEG